MKDSREGHKDAAIFVKYDGRVERQIFVCLTILVMSDQLLDSLYVFFTFESDLLGFIVMHAYCIHTVLLAYLLLILHCYHFTNIF